MNNFRENFRMFFFGLMVGLTVAGGFFVLKLDDYFNEMKIYKLIAKKAHLLKDNTEKSDVVIEATPVDLSKEKSSNFHKKIALKVDDNLKSASDLLNLDSLATTIIDSSELDMESYEEIVVKKDELLFSKKIEVITITKDSIGSRLSDSLLQQVSGVRIDKNVKQNIEVELWKSPLNYKGYKLNKNKLQLYGLQSVDGIRVYKLNDELYIKNNNAIYLIEPLNSFSAYQLVTDQQIINQLK